MSDALTIALIVFHGVLAFHAIIYDRMILLVLNALFLAMNVFFLLIP